MYREESELVNSLNYEITDYLFNVSNSQIQTQNLFVQLTYANHEIYEAYFTAENILSSLKQQNSTASNCVSEYGNIQAFGNSTNQTAKALEIAMPIFTNYFINISNTISNAQNEILNMVESIENCFSAYLLNQNETILNNCFNSSVSSF